MKAIVYTEYGTPDVLHLKEVEKPSPKDNEVLIKIHAVSVNFGDVIARNFKNVSPQEFNMPFLFWLLSRFGFGLNKPKKIILGNSFAGEVEGVGKDVTLYKKGDAVFGYTGENMGALQSISAYQKTVFLLQCLQILSLKKRLLSLMEQLWR
jgi:NADPH:quinone reductase-like Zn-dependent oxidoreductase